MTATEIQNDEKRYKRLLIMRTKYISKGLKAYAEKQIKILEEKYPDWKQT